MDAKYGPWALVIGGSEGIGRELVFKLAAQGLNVALTARKMAPLEEVREAMRARYPSVEVRILSQDVTSADMLEAIARFTDDIDVGLLIYNAGAMNRVPYFLDDTIEGHLRTIRMNCEGPTRLCHHFGRRMRARGGGGMILMSSVSGLVGSPRTAVYGATKAFDMLLAESLWYELGPHHIDVLCLVVGLTDTPSHDRLMPGQDFAADSSKDVAQQALDNLAHGPVAHVRSIQPQLDMFRTKDRRSVVRTFGDYTASFFDSGTGPIANDRPFGS